MLMYRSEEYNINMKTSKKKIDIDKLYIIAIFLVLLTITYATRSSIKNRISPNNQQAESTKTDNTNQPNTADGINYGPSSPSDNESINEQKNNADKPTDKPVNTGLSATITNTRIANSMAQVSVLVGGTTNGSCALTLTKPGSSDIQKTVSIIVRNGIATCEDFNIPISSLSNGSWTANIVLSSGQASSNPTQGTLQVGT